MKLKEYIYKLNEIVAAERRMAMIYRRLAQVISGPWRDSLAKQFSDHAKDEDSHAALAMRRIVALGGTVSVEVKPSVEWNSATEMLKGVEELEEEGVKNWQDLHSFIKENDPFLYVIEDILVQEQEHWDEARRWLDIARESSGGQVEGINESGEMVAGPTDDDIVGDSRRMAVYRSDPAEGEGDVLIGEAWQDASGALFGSGICKSMLDDGFVAKFYKNSSVGVDVSPLTVLAMRLSRSPLVRVSWIGDEDV